MRARNSTIEPWVQRFVAFLAGQQYSPGTIASHCTVVRRFLAFLERRQVDVAAAESFHVDSFLEADRRSRRRFIRSPTAGGWRKRRASSIHLFFRLAQGSWPPPSPPATTPREQLYRDLREGFRRWMLEVRGMSPLTFTKDWWTADRLFEWLGERATVASLRKLRPSDLDAFLAWRMPGLRRATRCGVCQGLRSFLRYLHAAGLIDRDLASCVTSPSHYWNESIPSVFTDAQIKAMLADAKKERTAVGRRDYAILLLLATYGLRAGEITRLRLGDIDWRREQFRITQSKTGRSSQLPLMVPVGEAILEYLRNGRPKSEHREVFLHVRAPHRPFSRGSSLTALVYRHLRRAGIVVVGKHGPHAFRYTRAVSLLRAAVPLKAISDLLGHRSSSSTDSYLKLATDDLRDVGLEVPREVAS